MTQDNSNALGKVKRALDIEYSDYQPHDGEEFMNKRQREYFRKLLLTWKTSILDHSQSTLTHLQNEELREPDMADRASNETGWQVELRSRDRERKLIAKIDAAIARLTEGSYGYCVMTGEPISLARLQARPIATMTLEAQQRHECDEKTHASNAQE